MRTKTVLTVLAIAIAALFLPSAGANAQPNVPILQVDTLVDLSKVIKGEASGAFFLPDGNIIAVIRDTPLIVDSKSGVVLRRLDSLIGQDVQCPKVSPDGRYLIAFSYKGTAVWDIVSGKILKMIGNATDYCFSPDRLKLYVIGGNPNNLGAVRVYDPNTLEEIERFAAFTGGTFFDISPDGQTLAGCFSKKVNNDYFHQFVLINLNDKNNFTVVETVNQGIKSMEFSPDGKQVAFHYNDGNGDNYIYIYNLDTKEKKYIREAELEALFGVQFYYISSPLFVSNDRLIFSCSDLSEKFNYYLSWDLYENKTKNLIDFKYNQSIDIKDTTILLCNQGGIIGYLNKTIVPVKDLDVPKDAYLTYKNNQLEYNSERVFLGESTIYDTTGKMILDLGSQPYVIGKNIIRINQPLPLGVYILTIKDNTSQLSYKFVVE